MTRSLCARLVDMVDMSRIYLIGFMVRVGGRLMMSARWPTAIVDVRKRFDWLEQFQSMKLIHDTIGD